jgi:ubiquinone/menaquinone biosynthesis C-methylase UbiE
VARQGTIGAASSPFAGNALMSVYDALAPSFDRQRAFPHGVPAAIRDAVLDALSASRPRLLDLGCGSGRIGAAFVAAGDLYVGADLSVGMLHAFTQRRDLPADRTPLLVQADGESLPFSDLYFDAVLLMQVLSAARGWRQLVTEASRVLRDAGSLLVGRTIAPERGVDAQMKQRLAELLDAVGIQPYGEQATDDALAWLAGTARESQTVTAAAWTAERTPRRFLERHSMGARFSALPAPVKDAAMQQVRDWAMASFGSLDTMFAESYRFELMIFRL